MTVPQRVVVAGQTFTIEVVTRDSLEPNVVGKCDPGIQRIRVADDMGPDATRETVLHELLHAIRELANLPRREHDVSVMAVQLLDTLRRNRELAQWLLA